MAAAVATPTLQNVFGKGDIGTLVQNHDFNANAGSQILLHTDLAPAYGGFNKQVFGQLDDSLKVMTVAALREISRLPNKSWNAVVSTMYQNPLLERVSDPVDRADQLVRRGTSTFKTDGGPDSETVREVKMWFTKLISDADVLSSTKIDIDVLANLVAATGATVDSFTSFFEKREQHEQTLMDIGIFRFPDLDHPYIKLYRIQLSAWSDSRRVLMVQEDSNGIRGEFNSMTFKPRDSIIGALNASAKQKAIAMGNAMFD